MTKLCTSLRFADLPAVAELLASAGSTGRLRITHGAWSGEILMRRGQIVRASLDAECGRAALEGMAIGLLDGEVNFADEALSEDGEPLLDPAESANVLKRLSRERQQMVSLIPSLQLVPRLVESTDSRPTDKRVTLVAVGAAALQIIPSLAFGRTLEEIARERGLASTVRDIATLVAGNTVKLEAPAGIERSAPTATEPSATATLAGPPVAPTARPTAPAPAPGHRSTAWPRSARVMVGRVAPGRPAPGGASQIGATPATDKTSGRVMPPRPTAAWSRPTSAPPM